MIEVRIENKKANHILNVNGKFLTFKDGSIFVTEDEAQFIKDLKDPVYTIVEPVVEKPKKQVKTRAKPKKE